MTREFVEPFGDRRQEIVFIGLDMDRVVIESLLKMSSYRRRDGRGPAAWARYEDPLPAIEMDSEESDASYLPPSLNVCEE